MDRIFNLIANGIIGLGRIVMFGVKEIPYKSPLLYANVAAILIFLYAFVAGGSDIAVLRHLLPRFMVRGISHIEVSILWACFCGYALGVYLFCLGVVPFIAWTKYQKAIDCLSLKNGIGEGPRLASMKKDANGQRIKLLVRSQGIGLDRYETKKGDLESAFGQVIEKIAQSANLKFVEITLTKGRVPTECRYSTLAPQLTTPYSFIVGQSVGGLITQSIRDLPHMLIAGTTGGGKSVFFKQALLGLAQTSPFFQMYLLDLKNGVEMKEFAALSNVVVAKKEETAVLLLRRIKEEMQRRFEYMEKRGLKKIDPARDKMDLIVVGVDEASVLYTPGVRGSTESKLIEEARGLTDNLAKLARAAAIHLVLATQKVSKETIDTRIQENIGGRMCFRMNTLQGSLTVLGNKMAFELPDQPGRAIWAAGYNFTEVQAPMIKDEEIVKECQVIEHEFTSGKRKNFQPMLTLEETQIEKPPERDVQAAA